MHTEVAEVLIDIEAQLRQLGLWDKIPPSSEALASEQPFAVDTLTLPQWLQFIFLPTIREMIEAGLEPAPCNLVKPPRVKASPIALECKYLQTVRLPQQKDGSGNNVVIGQIVGVHVADEVIRDGMIDPRLFKPLAYNISFAMAGSLVLTLTLTLSLTLSLTLALRLLPPRCPGAPCVSSCSPGATSGSTGSSLGARLIVL